MRSTAVKKLDKDQIKNDKAYINLKYKDFIIISKGDELLFYHNAKTDKSLNKIDAKLSKEKVRYNTYLSLVVSLEFNDIYTLILGKNNKIYRTHLKVLKGDKYSLLIMNNDLNSMNFEMKVEDFTLSNSYSDKSVYELIKDEEEIQKWKNL